MLLGEILFGYMENAEVTSPNEARYLSVKHRGQGSGKNLSNEATGSHKQGRRSIWIPEGKVDGGRHYAGKEPDSKRHTRHPVERKCYKILTGGHLPYGELVADTRGPEGAEYCTTFIGWWTAT